MATTVILIRHGQTDANITGFYMGWDEGDLNGTGYIQVRRLASRFAGLPIASIYTSPLMRAYKTAAILAESHNLRPEVLDDLIEFGSRFSSTVFLCGNHEQMFLDSLEDRNSTIFLFNGGDKTIDSYQRRGQWPPSASQ